jgi:hypothetical protein
LTLVPSLQPKWATLAVGCLPLVACHSQVAKQPPGAPPSVVSVSRDEPGGDADDPHAAALLRLLREPWGWRNDKDDVVHVPLPDWKNWRRIRYWGVPTLVGFRYGDDHHAVIAVWVRPVAEGTSSQQCLEQFESWAAPTAHDFSVDVGEAEVTRAPWKGAADPQAAASGEVVIRSFHAQINTLFSKKSYAAAYAGYVMWPGTCTIFGVAVPEREQAALAEQVRDRYVKDGFWRLERHSASPPPP